MKFPPFERNSWSQFTIDSIDSYKCNCFVISSWPINQSQVMPWQRTELREKQNKQFSKQFNHSNVDGVILIVQSHRQWMCVSVYWWAFILPPHRIELNAQSSTNQCSQRCCLYPDSIASVRRTYISHSIRAIVSNWDRSIDWILISLSSN